MVILLSLQALPKCLQEVDEVENYVASELRNQAWLSD